MSQHLGFTPTAGRLPAGPGGARGPVCLITPPSSFLLDERVFVSLGILKVAASLEARNYPVNFLDLSGVENYLAALSRYIADCADVAVGITATTPQLPAVMKIARAIRDLRPDLKLILGGPHVTLAYSALKLERKRGNFRSTARSAGGRSTGGAVRRALQRRRRARDLRGAARRTRPSSSTATTPRAACS